MPSITLSTHITATIVATAADMQWRIAEAIINPETGETAQWLCHNRDRRMALVTERGMVTYHEEKIAPQRPLAIDGDKIVIMGEKEPLKEGLRPRGMWTTAEQHAEMVELAARKRIEYSDSLRGKISAEERAAKVAKACERLEPIVARMQQSFAIRSTSQVFDEATMIVVKVTKVDSTSILAVTTGGVTVELPREKQHNVFLGAGGTVRISASPIASPLIPSVDAEAYVRSAHVFVDTTGEEPVIRTVAHAWFNAEHTMKIAASASKAAATLAANALKAEEAKRRQQAAIARSHVKGPKLSAPPKGGAAKALARGR